MDGGCTKIDVHPLFWWYDKPKNTTEGICNLQNDICSCSLIGWKFGDILLNQMMLESSIRIFFATLEISPAAA